jgi:FMN-dependent NADH-azoreductase
MKVFRLDSSIRVGGSVTRALADRVEQEVRRELPHAEFIYRDLGLHPLPPVWPDAVASQTARDDARTFEQRNAAGLAAELVDELLISDAYIFAVPMYNFGIPQQVKHWIDLIITDSRVSDVNRPLLPLAPAVLVEARGGGYGPGTPRDGWDHGTPYLKRVLVNVWGLDLAIVEAELTQADSTPAMAHLRELAHQRLAEAHSAAAELGVSLARRLRTGPPIRPTLVALLDGQDGRRPAA